MEFELDEIFPREMIGEIIRWVNPDTLTNLFFVSKWLNRMIIPLIPCITSSHLYFLHACQTGNYLGLVRYFKVLSKRGKWNGRFSWLREEDSYRYDRCEQQLLEAFRIVCINGNLRLAKCLYKICEGYCLTRTRYHKGGKENLALEIAAWKGYKNMVKWALSCGADNYDKALYLSCRRDDLEIGKILLNYRITSWSVVIQGVCKRRNWKEGEYCSELATLVIERAMQEQSWVVCTVCCLQIYQHKRFLRNVGDPVTIES